MKIVTGYQGKAHITSNDDQGRNQGIFGTDSYVTSVGQQFAATLVNANELDIADGEGVMQGVHFRIEPGEVDAAKLQNGTSGMKRIDLVVARYTKDSSTGIENVALVVIKGTESSSTPAVPAYNSGEILKGKNTVDFPLYKVTYNGINVSSVDRMFTKLQTMAELQTAVNKLNTEIVTQEFPTGSPANSNYFGECIYNIQIPTSIISKKIISYNVVSYSSIGALRSVTMRDKDFLIITNHNSNDGKVKIRFVLQ